MTTTTDPDVDLLDRVSDMSAPLSYARQRFGQAMHDVLMSTADDDDARVATLTALLGVLAAVPDLVDQTDRLTAAVRELGG